MLNKPQQTREAHVAVEIAESTHRHTPVPFSIFILLCLINWWQEYNAYKTVQNISIETL